MAGQSIMDKMTKLFDYECEHAVVAYNRYRQGNIIDYDSAVFFLDETSFVKNGNLDSHKFLWEQQHENMLRCYFLDEVNGNILYAPYENTFKEHIKILDSQGTLPIMSELIPHDVNDGTPFETVDYVPEKFRKYFQHLFRFLRFAHSRNYYTRGFTIDNLVMKEGIVRFFMIQLDHNVEEKKKEERIQDDLKCLENIIRNVIFGSYSARIPKDMGRWLDILVLIPESFDMDMDVIENHVAVLSHKKRTNLLEDIYYRQRVLGNSMMSKLLSQMGNSEGWYVALTEYDGPFYECAVFPGTRYNDSKNAIAKFDLLRFWRHFIVHFEENIAKFHLGYSIRHIDVMLMHKYGEKIWLLQEAMATKKTQGGVSQLAILMEAL